MYEKKRILNLEIFPRKSKPVTKHNSYISHRVFSRVSSSSDLIEGEILNFDWLKKKNSKDTTK